MIIAINSMAVGGMTEEGVLIEIETAGPVMSLVVSRYKFADYIADHIAKAEEHVVAAVDDAFGDDRHLGWVDVGATNRPVSSVAAVATKVLDAQLQNPPQNPPNSHPADMAGRSISETREKEDNELDPVQDNNARELTSINDNLVAESQGKDEALQLSATSGGASHKKRVRFHPDSNKIEEEERYESTTQERGRAAACTVTNAEEEQDPDEPGIYMPVDEEADVDAEFNTNTGDSMVLSEQEEEENDQETKEEEGGHQDEASRTSDCDDSEGDDEEDDDNKRDDDDGNPAAGCVCGTIHDDRYKVFWIQCDDCDVWYNAAIRCLGFSEEEAEGKGKWSCWACNPPDDSDDDETKSQDNDNGNNNAEGDGYGSESSEEPTYVRRKKRIRKAESPPKRDPNKVLEAGTIVEVDREGSHLYGGTGKIVKSYVDEDGDQLYSVSYIVEKWVEHDILAESIVEKGWSL